MDIVAVFETWHLGDGNYPPLKRGDLVNLSFEVEPDELVHADSTAPDRFHHRGLAEYDFTGLVLSVYGGEEYSSPIVVVEAENFRFYMNSPRTVPFRASERVTGRGTLGLDHYLWVEFLSRYPDPPVLQTPRR
jgi:hypothetical protein